MAPKTSDFSHEFSKYVPEDKDQRLVQTPYGRGVVVRTRTRNTEDNVDHIGASMKEIELSDWSSPIIEGRKDSSSLKPQKPHMLYSTTNFPSVSPVVGSDVLTQWGRGKVIEIRDDDIRTHVVKLSSWRLAGRSSVLCYLRAKECAVMKSKTIYNMDVFEKIEHANDLKQKATEKFKAKDFSGAQELYARALDAVRYIQHQADSTNEVRADLIVVMITCSNNAALCSSKKMDWVRTEKFARNALVLIEALEEKGNESKIRKVMNNDGIGDSQLFGTWKVKSLLFIAKANLEQDKESQTSISLKKAIKVISAYKTEGDTMFKQLSSQEKEIRKLHSEFSKRSKAARIKEKERAKAMFRSPETEGGNKGNNLPSYQATTLIPNSEVKSMSSNHLPSNTKHGEDIESNEDHTETLALKGNEHSPIDPPETEYASEEEEGDDNELQPSFIEEHSEALIILSGIAIGWFVARVIAKKR